MQLSVLDVCLWIVLLPSALCFVTSNIRKLKKKTALNSIRKSV